MKSFDEDPLDRLIRPPPNETPEERADRERKEAEARRVSDEIDNDIRKERAALKKQQSTVRVLLLGQSESGKSTTLKNFRMRFAPEEWQAELVSWRAVIQLNLIRSVLSILDAIKAELDNEPNQPFLTGDEDDETEFLFSDSEPGHEPQSSSANSNTRPLLTGQHQLLKLRLAPLRRVEADLKKQLGASAEDELADGAASDEYGTLGRFGGDGGLAPAGGALSKKMTRSREFSVRRLKDALTRNTSGTGTRSPRSHSRSRPNSDGSGSDNDDVDEATDVIANCREDIKTLWSDPAVGEVLKKRDIRLEDSAGFFLDDVDRIATREYVPSDDDVVRARLRTMGVQEYKIKVYQPTPFLVAGSGITDWSLYDVGGSRTCRHAWVPYFDNVTAIIFLAPVSCFDERLLEDSRINRLEDSFLLWRDVCSNKLLEKTSLILFMNKCDLLKRKLKMGVQVKDHLPSYGDRPNEAPSVVKYLKDKFRDIVRANTTDGGRVAYYYATSVTDIKTTYATLKTVKDIILRDHLKSADFV
ncbi:guanine nucleotide-binding protein alpha subunit [Coprinopsis cinerea okayama7|uniref:Guanine nucleotide-binding protein alpha subunit n=1 Tax=Coprinopsis cinerea (strain Okayama-7 / 130 / ATCC MYA-4618 / FGSC 9003) TaxID=240176 RepID=A8NCV4_COPC7|nr:guanine nucleotide-binding protein alpha subunit [Coprinopsis cinerea okayama7\|eukprot:XP_001832636.2 guanine nucleotide-binding protein alpha subunit [Coprinopsis cinerea okayama7\